MPNRKTFDPGDKYDHSSRSVMHPEKNDLKPDVASHSDAESGSDVRDSGRPNSVDPASRRGARRRGVR